MENLFPSIAASFTAFFGLLAMFKPSLVAKIASLEPDGKTGISEIRAVYGGWMFGLAIYTLWSQSSATFMCLGLGWLGAAIVRMSSFFVDKSYSSKNLRMVCYELLFSIAFLIKFI